MSDNRSSGVVVEDEGTMMMVEVKNNHCGKMQMNCSCVTQVTPERRSRCLKH